MPGGKLEFLCVSLDGMVMDLPFANRPVARQRCGIRAAMRWVGSLSRRACLGFALLGMSGCGGTADEGLPPLVQIDDGPVDPASYAGEVEFFLTKTTPVRGHDIPFPVYVGLAPQTETRMDVNAFVDLRELQGELPDLVSGHYDASCGVALDVNFIQAVAEGNSVRASAEVDSSLYRCRKRGTDEESRGIRYLSPRADVVVSATAEASGTCIRFKLVDVQLSPKGLIGGLANLFGVTEKLQDAVMTKGAEALDAHPVCPSLPDGLGDLDPDFETGGPREIGKGGIGAGLSGSLDVSADTLISLLSTAKSRGMLEGLK